MSLFWVIASVLALVIGIWIGMGAPGWPHPETTERRHTSHRSLNPAAWGRTSNRARQRPREIGSRKPRLRNR